MLLLLCGGKMNVEAKIEKVPNAIVAASPIVSYPEIVTLFRLMTKPHTTVKYH